MKKKPETKKATFLQATSRKEIPWGSSGDLWRAITETKEKGEEGKVSQILEHYGQEIKMVSDTNVPNSLI